MQLVFIITNVLSSIPGPGQVASIQLYVLKYKRYVNTYCTYLYMYNVGQVDGYLQVLKFSVAIKWTARI